LPRETDRCPECGLATATWIEAWRLRLAHLALTLIVWGMPLMAAAWMLNAAVRGWLSTTSVVVDDLAIVRPTEALTFIPGLMTACGLALLAASTPPGRARSFALSVAGAGVVMLCLMGAQRALPGSSLRDAPVWARTVTIRDSAWWAAAVLGPLSAGALLLLGGRLAHTTGLSGLGRACARAALWIPIAALVLAALVQAVDLAAATALRSLPSPYAPAAAGRTTPIQTPWYWIEGPRFVRTLAFAAIAAMGTTVWTAALVVRARITGALAVQSQRA